MTAFVLTVPSTDLTPASALAALADGTATVHTERENGTFRRRHYLAEGTKARETAEWIALQRTGQEADGDVPAVQPRSMKWIASELHMSVSAVRRTLNDLAITRELEEMEAEELADLLTGFAEAEAGDPLVDMAEDNTEE